VGKAIVDVDLNMGLGAKLPQSMTATRLPRSGILHPHEPGAHRWSGGSKRGQRIEGLQTSPGRYRLVRAVCRVVPSSGRPLTGPAESMLCRPPRRASRIGLPSGAQSSLVRHNEGHRRWRTHQRRSPESEGVIGIPPHHHAGLCPDRVHNFSGIGSTVHQIAKHPEFVVLLRQRSKRLQIPVKVGDNDDLHQTTVQSASGFTRMLRNSILLSL
jgi:hypothetical protein